MGAHRWLRLGHYAASFVPLGASLLAVYVLSPPPDNLSAWAIVALIAWLTAAYLVGIVVHELGHVLAIKLAGKSPTAIHLLGPPDRVVFHIGTLRVGLGIKTGGEVAYEASGLSVAQSAVIAVAGPAADIVTAPLILLLPLARWTAVYLAVMMCASGLENLIPAKSEDGSLTDGAVLLRVRARVRSTADVRQLLATPDWTSRQDAARRLISGWVLDAPEAEECLKQLPNDRHALQRLYAQEWSLPERPELEFLNIVHALSWKVVAKPDVSAELADLASARIEWVLAHVEKGNEELRSRLSDMRHTLAVVRLRQGKLADVRRLCADPLAADLSPGDRATVLATVAMASHQLWLLASARRAVGEALALDPSAELVPEAVAMISNGAAPLTTVAAAVPPSGRGSLRS